MASLRSWPSFICCGHSFASIWPYDMAFESRDVHLPEVVRVSAMSCKTKCVSPVECNILKTYMTESARNFEKTLLRLTVQLWTLYSHTHQPTSPIHHRNRLRELVYNQHVVQKLYMMIPTINGPPNSKNSRRNINLKIHPLVSPLQRQISCGIILHGFTAVESSLQEILQQIILWRRRMMVQTFT